MTYRGWIGVDLDGTLAHYDGWKGVDHIGEPVPAMLERVKGWLAGGVHVKIVTARVSDPDPVVAAFACSLVRDWCRKHLGQALEVTNAKDFGMLQMWDDRAVQVEPNTGRVYLHPDVGAAVAAEIEDPSDAVEAVRRAIGGWGEHHFRGEAERLVAALRREGLTLRLSSVQGDVAA